MNISNIPTRKVDVSSVFTEAYNQGFRQAVATYQSLVFLLFLSCVFYIILTAYMNRNPELWENRIFNIFERANFTIIFGISTYLFISLFINPLW